MSKLFEFIISFSILLTGISIAYHFIFFIPQKHQFDLDLNLKIHKIQKETQNNLEKQTFFENNKTCFNYKESILRKYEYDMTEVFYSQTLNTCIFAYWDYVDTGDRFATRHIIKDLFNDKIIFHKTNAPKWEEKINELKE